MPFKRFFLKIDIIRLTVITIYLSFVVITLWNTNKLIQRIEYDERLQMELWGTAQQKFASGVDLNQPIEPLTFKILTSKNSIPMIVVDKKNRLLFSNNIDQKKIKKDSISYINKLIGDFSLINEPIEIKFENNFYQKLYYGNSKLVTQLKLYPVAFLIIISILILLIFMYYRSSQIALENKLWSAMAKETAHQLGTPISSLLGWLMVLEENYDSETLNKMNKDVERLKTISERFSKIGAIPEKKPYKLSSIVDEIVEYMRIRIPSTIEIIVQKKDGEIPINLNKELIQWVLENMIKNSIDSIEKKGKIKIEINWGGKANLKISDTGSGIKKELQSKVFDAGVSTKTRGWGIGLSLTKRIIEKYHKGRIKLLNSSKNGTEFLIEIPKN
ncbi:MAG: HAMP domain-containing sensor histidine kinase [Bacteroidota bacterium]|nr:HAMP domain-containing sensor histidine kinase [Bacteroidota bacterium]